MDNTIYGFSHNPFAKSQGPDPVFAHEEYRRARGALEYTLMDGTGIVVIAGEQGTGKHTLIHDLLSRYPLNDLAVGQVTLSGAGNGDVLAQVASAFDIELAGQDDETATAALTEYLATKQAESKKTLLVIHDADKLDVESLEKLRRFISLHGHGSSALYIYLVGQPGIQQLINDFTDTYPLGDAVTHLRLGPMLTEEETLAYIEQRLKGAGWEGNPELADDVPALLHTLSAGIPGNLNLICSRLLENASEAGKTRLDAADVKDAAAPLNRDTAGENAAKDSGTVDNTSQERPASDGPEAADLTTPTRPAPVRRKRRRKRKTSSPAVTTDKAARVVNDPPLTVDPDSLDDIHPDPDVATATAHEATATASRRKAPEHQGSRAGGVALLVLFIVLVLGAGAYWDLSNTRRLMQIEPIAELLNSPGIAPLLPAANEPREPGQAAPQQQNTDPVGAVMPTATVVKNADPEPTADSTPTDPLPQQSRELIEGTITDSSPAESASTTEPMDGEDALSITDELQQADTQNSAPSTQSGSTDAAEPEELASTTDFAPADTEIATPAPEETDSAATILPLPDEEAVPERSDTEQAAGEIAAQVLPQQEAIIEEPPGPRMTLLLPSGPTQRYIDVALTNRGRGLIISPELGRALQPYADRLLWQRDGTLQVIPEGLNSLTGEYDPIVLRESVDGIAFVTRNFRGVGLLIRRGSNGPASADSLASASALVTSRLEDLEFASREVSLVNDISTNTASVNGPAPLYLLVVPHR